MNRYNPSEFTRQTEWVERRGLLLVLAFFLGGLGGGLYLVSLFFDFYAGMVAAFFIVAVGKGGSHLLYLGKPLRFWRAFVRPQSSWISRGIISVVGFVVFVGLQLLFSLVPGGAGTFLNQVVQVLAIASAIVLIAYTGFALGVVNAIPFWNTALMPLLFIVYSLLGGAGLTLGLALGLGNSAAPLADMENLAKWLLLIAVMVLGIYLWVSYHVNTAAQYSVVQVTRGNARSYFVGGAVILGLLIPFLMVTLTSAYKLPDSLLLSGVACELIGGFSLRYSILKAGVYSPII